MLACLWKRAALSTVTPIGNLEGGFVYRKVRETDEGLLKQTVFLYGSEGILEGGILYWEL